jgi:cytochrome c oxidase subunit II
LTPVGRSATGEFSIGTYRHLGESAVNQKWWSLLFGTVMLACTALFVVAPIVDWWLPRAVSHHAEHIDNLFYLILAITGFFFILTEALLISFMYLYSAGEPGEVRGPSVFWNVFKPLTNVFNTATKVEMAWTLVPAVILLYLAFAQVSTWADVKYKSRLDKFENDDGQMPVQVEVSARQFEWRMRYPSSATWREWQKNPDLAKRRALAERWVKNGQFDDVHVVNELHIIKDRHCVVQLSTKDVIHSFNSAHMRVKQDALPGKTIPVWFKPIASNVTPIKDKDGKIVRWEDGGGRDEDTGKPKDPTLVWDIACAELCGWGHYRMVGKIYVHESEEDFLTWLESAAARQHDVGATAPK